jgi:hypothetical protein
MCFQGSYGHARVPKSSIRGLKSTLTTDPALSEIFNINELKSALKNVKLGTAGFDGVYPEVIAIQKLDKDRSNPAYYRSNSSLSVMYKLHERLILQRIQPLIEAATLVHQA